MQAKASDNLLLVAAPGGVESYECSSAEEAGSRATFINEGMSWIGTPFLDCADIKGPKGAVDCAMMMVRSAVDSGLIPPFDPRPYSPRWHLHRGEEKFVNWLTENFGAREIEAPKPGDIAVWLFGRTFSHGGILINSAEVVHAYYAARMTLVSRRDEPLLASLPLANVVLPRPVRYFDLWSALT